MVVDEVSNRSLSGLPYSPHDITSSVTTCGRATFPKGEGEGERKPACLLHKPNSHKRLRTLYGLLILAFPWGKVAAELARLTDEGHTEGFPAFAAGAHLQANEPPTLKLFLRYKTLRPRNRCYLYTSISPKALPPLSVSTSMHT